MKSSEDAAQRIRRTDEGNRKATTAKGGTVQYRTATLLFLSKFVIWPEDLARVGGAAAAAASAAVMYLDHYRIERERLLETQ